MQRQRFRDREPAFNVTTSSPFTPEQQRLSGRGLWDSDHNQPIIHWHQLHCQLAASVYGCARDTDTHTHSIQWQTGKHALVLSKSTLKSMSRYKLLISWWWLVFLFMVLQNRTVLQHAAYFFRNSKSSNSVYPIQLEGTHQWHIFLIVQLGGWNSWHWCHDLPTEPLFIAGSVSQRMPLGFGGLSLRTVGQRVQCVNNTARVSSTIPW